VLAGSEQLLWSSSPKIPSSLTFFPLGETNMFHRGCFSYPSMSSYGFGFSLRGLKSPTDGLSTGFLSSGCWNPPMHQFSPPYNALKLRVGGVEKSRLEICPFPHRFVPLHSLRFPYKSHLLLPIQGPTPGRIFVAFPGQPLSLSAPRCNSRFSPFPCAFCPLLMLTTALRVTPSPHKAHPSRCLSRNGISFSSVSS